ncbi:hypothetical protein Hsero_2008 [Herbaspirillum seropedicae SmR1]|uniref:Uncharacterized protein n=1 Tax=Herbaspirillum seropedicae (strain SmR1) TaxID=757424 RepID=D8ISG5_HERSS|nr:hypothetical protein Hsero_2008 [Herbaspirillum seropedicae SmR1]
MRRIEDHVLGKLRQRIAVDGFGTLLAGPPVGVGQGRAQALLEGRIPEDGLEEELIRAIGVMAEAHEARMLADVVEHVAAGLASDGPPLRTRRRLQRAEGAPEIAARQVGVDEVLQHPAIAVHGRTAAYPVVLQPAQALAVLFIGHGKGIHVVGPALARKEAGDVSGRLHRQRSAAEQDDAVGRAQGLHRLAHQPQRGFHQREMRPCAIDAIAAEVQVRIAVGQSQEGRDVGLAVNVQEEMGLRGGRRMRGCIGLRLVTVELGHERVQQARIVVGQDQVGDVHRVVLHAGS